MNIGLLNIMKEPGMTSHGVVSQIRRVTKIKKVGHAGTLDPEATGVLPVCVGEATKMVQYLDHRRKIYRVEMKLGVVTDTQDLTGEVLQRSVRIPVEKEVRRAVESFEGEYWQIPPMHSAIKQNGKKLYDLARGGMVVDRKARHKIIYYINWISMDRDVATFDVSCSEGTYVRTLCHDAGQVLGCGAAMSCLVRLESCRQIIKKSIVLNVLKDSEDWRTHLVPIDHALMHYSGVTVQDYWRKKITNGLPAPFELKIESPVTEYNAGVLEANNQDEKLVRVYLGPVFIGMGDIQGEAGLVKMRKLLLLTAIDFEK